MKKLFALAALVLMLNSSSNALTIDGNVEAELTGGTTGDLIVLEMARVDVTGTTITMDLQSRDQAIVTLTADSGGWNLPLGPVIPLSGVLTGNLVGGGSIVNLPFERDSSASIILLSVPEPGTMLAVAGGLLGLLWLGRRRRCARIR